jgi:Arc/MetJ-type ribon-helix-helix transcriptional regulator
MLLGTTGNIRGLWLIMERVDELINSGVYSNRSEAVRDAIRKHIKSFDEVYSKGREEF